MVVGQLKRVLAEEYFVFVAMVTGPMEPRLESVKLLVPGASLCKDAVKMTLFPADKPNPEK